MTIVDIVELAQTFIDNIKNCSVLTFEGHGSKLVRPESERTDKDPTALRISPQLLSHLNVQGRCVNGKAGLSKVKAQLLRTQSVIALMHSVRGLHKESR